MGKYKKFVIPAGVFGLFIVLAILISIYTLSLPLKEITNEGCQGFSSYQLDNCIAYYQRVGDLAILQRDAKIALWILWLGLLAGAACSFYLFPRILLSNAWKVNILFLGLLVALLVAGLPLILFTDLIANGFIFALSLVIAFLTLELVLVSSTKEVVYIDDIILSMNDVDI
jgi:hypothetical protein